MNSFINKTAPEINDIPSFGLELKHVDGGGTLFNKMEILIKSPHGEKTVFFDDEDWPLLKDYIWHIQNDKGNFYCRYYVKVNGKFISKKMHRVVMGVADTPHPHIDHIDGNGLNNRKLNLRKATIAENSRNVGPTSRNTTGFKGVYQFKAPHKQAGLYTAALRCKDIKYHGGYFKTAVEAAIKYNEMARKYHGEFAYQNPIPESK